ncbi:MAG: hypothetical protein QMD12_01585 [Candidatus Aenigmarchaeota archaeon]|nr:hypothetical protein [Candidatus Aenigmarchaeota archaeon]
MVKKNWKIVTFWVLGSICILLGSMISGHLEKTLGVTDVGFGLALLISFVLFLVGGLLWISVAIAVKEAAEE